MANKLSVKVSPILAGDANYKALTDIPATYLGKQGLTVLMYPGTYTAPTDAVYDDVAFVGVGDRDEIVISGDMTIANTSANTITFENITFTGSNADATSDSVCVSKLGADSTVLRFRNCTFNNAEHAVRHHGELTSVELTKQVYMDYCDASTVNQALVANANAEVNFSALNTAANAYFQNGGVENPTVTVRASTAGAANGAATVETVLAVIS